MPLADQASPRYQYLAVLLVSAAVLLFQILLTRLFSLVFSYHYTFLGVSVALCGFGLGGAAVGWAADSVRWSALSSNRQAAICALLFAVGIDVTLGMLVLLPDPVNAVIPALPAALACAGAGGMLAIVFRDGTGRVAPLYATSLAGSALGCALVFPLLAWLGGPRALLLTALLAAAAAFLIAGPNSPRPRFVTVSAVLLPAIALAALWLPPVRVSAQSGKEYAEACRNYTPTIVASRWSGFARTDLVSVAEMPAEMYLYTDGAAPAPMLQWTGGPVAAERFRDFVGAAAFGLVAPGPRVLLLGSGGGRDVLVAKAHNASAITAVEVNPDIVALVHENADFCGPVYTAPEVELHEREARSFLRGEKRRWDLIYVSLPRSQRSSNLAGYQLVENYLMTAEAVDDEFSHLSPDGALAVVAYGEADMLKLFGTVVAHHVDAGMSDEDAVRSIAILRQPTRLGVMRYAFVARSRPFTAQEVQLAKRVQGERGVEIQWLPGTASVAGIRTGSVIENLCGQAPAVGIHTWIQRLSAIQKVNLAIPTDEKPFFYKWNLGVPAGIKATAIGALPGVLLVCMLAWRRVGRREEIPVAEFAPVFLLFGCLGAGYALVEVGLVHKTSLFLGTPAYSLAVILGALLLGGSAGAVTAARSPGGARSACLSVAVGAVAGYFALSPVLGMALAWPLPLRLFLTAVLVTPFGVVLGRPFPLALQVLSENRRHLIPWVWAVNGLAAVVGSIAAVVIAMTFGFSTSLAAAAALYVVAAWAANH